MSTYKPGLVTFTFDDGISKNTELLLDILEKEKITATFFIIAETLETEKNQDRLKKIHEKGHTIGNHSYSHPNLNKLSADSLEEEITKSQKKIKSILPDTPIKYMRPPYGSANKKVKQSIADMGYTLVLWNVDGNDWDVKKSKEELLTYYKNVFSKANKAKDRYIILQHDRRTDSVELIPEMAEIIRKNGFEIVSLDDYYKEV